MALPPVVPMKLPTGKYLVFVGQDMINNSLATTGAWEPWTVDIAHALATQLDPRPGTIIDVGANLGAITIALAHRLPPGYAFHCFEMQRIVYYQLCGNIVINGLENIFAHHMGVGATDEVIAVPRPDYASDPNVGAVSASQAVRDLRQSVPTDQGNTAMEPARFCRLDSLGLQDVRLIKIDVEGMELDVLKGGAKTLARNNYPPLILEIWKSGSPGERTAQAEALLAHIEDLGYASHVTGSTCIAQHRSRPSLQVEWDGEARTFRTAPQAP